MKRHISYLKYVLRHKWFVFKAGRKLNVPLWSLIWHDWDKFLPGMWFSYARTFYNTDGTSRKDYTDPYFDMEWLGHQHKNKHHWQHWILHEDDGDQKTLCMPIKDVREMVADWKGAGAALGFNKPDDTRNWYLKNREHIYLHPMTEYYVNVLLGIESEPELVNKFQWYLSQKGNMNE